MFLTLDDQPPVVESLEVPREVLKNTSVTATATVIPPASKIKEALFFFGAAADVEKAKAAGQTVQGRPTDESARTWQAVLPVPKDTLGKLAVTARFTSGVNLSESLTEQVTVVAPPPPPDAANGASKKEKPTEPGAIKGVVRAEARLPQPGLDVFLYAVDPDAKEAKDKYKYLQSQKATPQGVFIFKDLKPGLYMVYSVKASTSRKGSTEVTVPPGQTAQADLELLLP